MPKKALTLIEIIMAVVILSLIIGGLVNVFISARRWIIHAHLRMSSSELGKRFLDPLAVQVRQDQWGSNCLSSTPTAGCDLSSWTDPLAKIEFIPSYAIEALGSTKLRKVALTVRWQERTP